MSHVFECQAITKRYGKTVALDQVTLAIASRQIVGLAGRNGSGKTTLLRHMTGYCLPDEGSAHTLGTPTPVLDRAELARIGVVEQGDPLIPWMKARQLLRYVSSFYTTWDRDLEATLMTELEVDPEAKVGAMSPGSRQKLSLVVATCHHPELLLLDEPLSALDPIARQSVLGMLLDRFSSDAMTIVISTHMLRDIEPVINRLVCLEQGRVVADEELDVLRERHAEWVVTSASGALPREFSEPWILAADSDGTRARLQVRDPEQHLAEFIARYRATVESRPLNLEALFPVLIGRGGAGRRGAAVVESAGAGR
ncbi:MAG: ABC transporter ATP-binding protein [Gemmatimonadales bacterium]|nr:ABC transporter ATP-binding protein [Gemmatimonadales bacterium]